MAYLGFGEFRNSLHMPFSGRAIAQDVQGSPNCTEPTIQQEKCLRTTLLGAGKSSTVLPSREPCEPSNDWHGTTCPKGVIVVQADGSYHLRSDWI